MEIPKLKLYRYKVLEQFYKNYEVKGEDYLDAFSDEFKEAIGLSDNDIAIAMNYLSNANLLDTDESNSVGCITKDGIDEYESTQQSPNISTINFPANIYNISHSTIQNSQIQQGSSGSSQELTISNNDLNSIKEIFNKFEEIYKNEIRNTLEEVARNILDQNIEEAKEEISKEIPLHQKIKEKVKILIGNIQLISLASNLVHDKLVPLIHEIGKFIS